MPTQRSFLDEEDPSLDGPDYVALVIEWDELADDIERRLHTEQSSLIAEPQPQKRRMPWRKIAIGAGALGIFLLARRLHH